MRPIPWQISAAGNSSGQLPSASVSAKQVPLALRTGKVDFSCSQIVFKMCEN
jgi:hypothetical protein